jgi:hypothetical protein
MPEQAYSKSDYVYVSGKAKWAHLVRPKQWSDETPAWEITLYPNQESYAKILELKEPPSIKNVLKKDDDGYFIKFKRVTELKKKDGRRIGLEPPFVVKDDGMTPLTETLVGNGSDVTCKLEVYRHRGPEGPRSGRAARLVGVRVDNLVPFNVTRDLTDREAKMQEGVKDQPAQLF